MYYSLHQFQRLPYHSPKAFHLEVLSNAAQIRNHGRILQKSQGLRPAEIPTDVQYHRQYYQQFTNKSSLNILQKQSEKHKEDLRAMMQQCTSYNTDESSKPKRS